MRILIYDPYAASPPDALPFLGGVGEVVRAASGEVVVVTHALAPVYPKEGLSAGTAAVRVIHEPLPLPWEANAADPAAPVTFFRRFIDAIRRWPVESARAAHLAEVITSERPNIIIAIDAEIGAPIALRAAKLAALRRLHHVVPVVCNTKGSDVLVVPGRSPRQRKRIAAALRSSVGALTYTAPHRRAVRELTGDPNFPCFDIPPCRDLSTFRPDDEHRATIGAPPLVLCLRGTTAVYRPFVMIEACAIANRTTPLRLRFMSSPAAAQECRDVAAQHGLAADRLELLTDRVPHSEMPRHYAEATVVAQALLNESLGFTGIEAMACGRVVVQPNSEVAREVLNPEQHGLLSGADAPWIAAKLVEVLGQPEARLRLEASNVAFARARFDCRTVIRKGGAELLAWLGQRCDPASK